MTSTLPYTLFKMKKMERQRAAAIANSAPMREKEQFKVVIQCAKYNITWVLVGASGAGSEGADLSAKLLYTLREMVQKIHLLKDT